MIDRVWMLVNVKDGGVWYSPPATNAADCWKNALKWECATSGVSPSPEWYEIKRLAGWRARKVEIHKHT